MRARAERTGSSIAWKPWCRTNGESRHERRVRRERSSGGAPPAASPRGSEGQARSGLSHVPRPLFLPRSPPETLGPGDRPRLRTAVLLDLAATPEDSARESEAGVRRRLSAAEAKAPRTRLVRPRRDDPGRRRLLSPHLSTAARQCCGLRRSRASACGGGGRAWGPGLLGTLRALGARRP